ncbi:mannose-1-phosphate guanylyltransferase/mannose-6-phosphate isomerase [Clostridium sp. BSD9I1]|uniref:mannose-1-phosphate guanylyltransferase/mannose-6-phosphate isomerase n=1 Tax=Clostridium sp. BSD9I1 TaxID=2003589 RepID=UPI001646EF6D|nr:mannose-1-phosphate guanylyltransferase/mannose-6-phosphate isomerase [Clostridium sp. BSD9I1]
MNTVSLILAGGSGTRLWPVSRKNTPKQLLSLIGNRTLLQETCKRLWPIVPPDKQWIITNKELYNPVTSQIKILKEEFHKHIKDEEYISILQEPTGKNTAPAIFWAAARCKELYGEDTILLVLPSDHLIMGEYDFINTINIGIEKAKEGYLVTFGIKPTHPETGYGYIKVDKEKIKSNKPYSINKFVEKPDYNTAKQYIKEGNYLWNSGMFAFHVGTLFKEGERLCKDVSKIYNKYNSLVMEEVACAYDEVEEDSIDYAIMESTNKAWVVPASFGWNDIGTWKSLFEVSQKDKEDNLISGDHIVIDTKNSLIYGKDRLIAAIGLENMAIIDTDDALMVCPLSETQRVKEVVNKLKLKNSKEYIEHKTVERPWGSYKIIEEKSGYKIKKIIVKPNQKLSLQLHYHRSEHWIVVSGTAKIKNGDNEEFLYENQSTYIPKGTLHRLENPGLIPLEIIEVQCGAYLEEDDIVRFDDEYGRNI